MSRPLRVLCLGGGYTALYLSRKLTASIRNKQVELTIVSKENFHVFHGFIAEMLAGRMQPYSILSSARRIFPPARFICAEVEAVDYDQKKVRISRRLDGKTFELEYDHVVLALGATDDLARYPGVSEHTFRLKSFWECFKMRNHLIQMLEMAEIETDPEERKKLLTFVIIGGGYGGIEVASEFREFFRQVTKKDYPHLHPDEARVLVVHSGERILPELVHTQPKLVNYAEKVLKKAGLEIHTNMRIVAATSEEAVLSDGTKIPTRTIISSAGNAMPALVKSSPFEKDDRGRIKVDATLRVPGHNNVWAAGDCAAMPHPSGGTCPAVAIYAMMAGRQIAVNIRRLVGGKSARPYRFTGLGDACALGNGKAVSQVKGIRFYGFPAWLVWRSFFLYFVPSRERKVRIMLDWLLSPIFGREIIDVRIDEPHGVRAMMFEPGQDIIRQGDVGRTMYAIVSGEAEVIREDETRNQTVLARLKPGDHFGEIAVFQNRRRTATVRAVTRVELISIGKQEAVALSATLKPFDDALNQPKGS
jgi:NADH dehydrogenase